VEKSSSSFAAGWPRSNSPESRYDDLYISNYVTLNVLDVVKRIPGTTNVQIFGAKDYAMRIWVKPDRLTQLKLTTADLIAALNEQNASSARARSGRRPQRPAGARLYDHTKGRLDRSGRVREHHRARDPDGSTLRLKDVARVELGSKDYDFIGRVNGKERCWSVVFLQPGANALDDLNNVKKTVQSLAARFRTDSLTRFLRYPRSSKYRSVRC